MKPLLIGIFFPDFIICLHVNPFHPIHGDHVKFPHRLIILRGISRCNNHPPFRYFMSSEGFALKKLQHGRSQSFRHAVYLIQKQYPLRQSRLFHFLINGSHNLAHGILRYGILPASVLLFGNKGQADGALSGMMGNGIGHQSDFAFSGNLFHNLRLSHPRRPQQKHGPLTDHRNFICSVFIFFQISFYGIFDLFLGSFNVHDCFLFKSAFNFYFLTGFSYPAKSYFIYSSCWSKISFMAQDGTSTS